MLKITYFYIEEKYIPIMTGKVFVVGVFLAVAAVLSEAKIYDRCELAATIRNTGVPEYQLGTWVCIAYHESRLDTAAVNRNTWDYGIFQISSIYWCQQGDCPGKACGVSCNSLLDDDISGDIACVRQIYTETERMGKYPGFSAWVTWQQHCAGDNSGWVAGC